jgi:DNA-binding transcriptional MerR regulator
MVAGNNKEVFRIGKVAEMIGRSDQTIRDWEETGIIPKPIVQSAHRYYTQSQVIMLRELADVISLLRSTSRKDLDSVVAVKSAEIHSKWSN